MNAQNDDGGTSLMLACLKGHLMAATILIGHGADLALLNNAGESALRLAEELVASDEEEPGEDEAPPTAAQRKEHKALVALLEGLGAT